MESSPVMCNDGNCIDLSKKCDIINDCFDSSDEHFCSLLSMKHYGQNYNPFMADIGFDEDSKIVPAAVNISIDLMKITGIKEIEMKFEMKFNLLVDWIDSRLTWMNLLTNKSLNLLFDDEIAKMWVPTLVFRNTEQEVKTTADNDSMILIDKVSSFKTDLFDLYETAYYSGSQNPISYSRKYTQEFLCQFELKKYPFDTQTCQIVLSPRDKETNFVRLIPVNVAYKGPVEMMTYSVIGYNIKEAKEGSVVVEIKLKRMVSRLILSTYLPSLCILIIAQVNLKILFCINKFKKNICILDNCLL